MQQDIVNNINNGIICNKLFHQWNKIKTNQQHKKWEQKIKKVKFGSYGTTGILETLETFGIKESSINSITKTAFINEIKQAII